MEFELNTLTFDNLEIGYTESFIRKVTREDIKTFSNLTGDKHPLHTDKRYAQKHGFSDVIAQGFLVSSFVSTLIGMRLPGEHAIIASQSAEYLKPIYPNTELKIVGTVKNILSKFSMIVVETAIFNGDTKVYRGTANVMLRGQKKDRKA